MNTIAAPCMWAWALVKGQNGLKKLTCSKAELWPSFQWLKGPKRRIKWRQWLGKRWDLASCSGGVRVEWFGQSCKSLIGCSCLSQFVLFTQWRTCWYCLPCLRENSMRLSLSFSLGIFAWKRQQPILTGGLRHWGRVQMHERLSLCHT